MLEEVRMVEIELFHGLRFQSKDLLVASLRILAGGGCSGNILEYSAIMGSLTAQEKNDVGSR
jgi:hypothetical protein